MLKKAPVPIDLEVLPGAGSRTLPSLVLPTAVLRLLPQDYQHFAKCEAPVDKALV